MDLRDEEIFASSSPAGSVQAPAPQISRPVSPIRPVITVSESDEELPSKRRRRLKKSISKKSLTPTVERKSPARLNSGDSDKDGGFISRKQVTDILRESSVELGDAGLSPVNDDDDIEKL